MSLSLPSHAYVPGQTARHDPAVFAALHDSVTPGMGIADLTASAAWHAGWAYYKAGFFWEAHEALEPVWMQMPPETPERHFVQGLIQIANAALKARMGRPRAVLRLCDIAAAHLTRARGDGGSAMMGLRFNVLDHEIATLRAEASAAPDQKAHTLAG